MPDPRTRNILDSISLVQTTDCALAEIQTRLKYMYELVEEYKNSVTSPAREQVESELWVCGCDIDRIVESTAHMGIKLLDGSNRKIILSVERCNAIDEIELAMADLSSQIAPI